MSMSLFAGNQLFTPIEPIEYDYKKAQLGKNLFYDTRLSPSGTISCERCHNLYWNTSGTIDHNIKVSGNFYMNVPTILNSALNFIFFKNGRSRDIYDQVSESITDLNQLGSSKEFVLQKVNSNSKYRTQFNNLYDDGVTFDNIVDAIVNFEKSLLTKNSRFDMFLRGEKNALSDDEKSGFNLFKKAGCVNCHSGVNLGANVYFLQNVKNIDKNDLLDYYKVPGLRNISKTSPYFYTGSVADLKDAIRHISSIQTFYTLNDEQVELIYKFLLTLTGEKPEILK